MLKSNHKKVQAIARAGQAATELAVFGAILIFLLGTIIRTAVGNSYQQNQSFKAMRMAMLTSWNGATSHPGGGAQDTSHNSAQILFIEDRLSPDYSKYGDLDRNPFIASGSGTLSYNLLYPLSDAADVRAALPIMDVYINGQQFPFTQASYVPDLPIALDSLHATPAQCASLSSNSCAANQCYRNLREWVKNAIKEGAFVSPTVAPVAVTNPACLTSPTTALQRACQEKNNACTIFTDLQRANMFPSGTVTGTDCDPTTQQAYLDDNVTSPVADSTQWTDPAQGFVQYYQASFPNTTAKKDAAFYGPYLQAILKILQDGSNKYKLFYTMVANPGTSVFSTPPPSCASPIAKDQALCSTLTTTDANGNPFTNTYGEMEYDLRRLGDYAAVDTQLPLSGCPSCLRNYMSWKWAATPGTTPGMIGLDKKNNVYPNYDIDGRLKEVTIYNIWQDAGNITNVAFEDSEGGDIDGTWDLNSCGPKPGLKSDSQVLTFTKNGTYLLINEGKLYNPETGQVVRSANKRQSIDLIQRTIQLSNNTGRFCTVACPDGNGACGANIRGYCGTSSGINSSMCTTTASGPTHVCGSQSGDTGCATPNLVAVCVSGTDNCFTTANIGQTCYDTNSNTIFIRSRLEDRRGRFWMTNTSGHLRVQ